jgi:TonB family protein
MGGHFVSQLLLVGTLSLPLNVEYASARSHQNTAAQNNGAILTRLSQPLYPALARQARIQGDVDVTVNIRQDGSIESALVSAGHAMLAPAALESAKASQFECRGCSEVGASYALKYKFEIISRGYPKDCDSATEKQPIAEVDESGHQVTVPAWATLICDPADVKFRAAKCLYLWRCGVRVED